MAIIQVLYRLSPKGKRQALGQGRNAGNLQCILLQSLNHKAPATIDSLLSGSIPDLTEASVQPIAESVVNTLITSMTSLLKPMGFNTDNIVKEVATPELWALACSLSQSDAHGQAVVNVCMDGDVGELTGYAVRKERYTWTVVPEVSYSGLDATDTAANLLPMEAKRRASLEEKRLLAEKEAEIKNATDKAEHLINQKERSFEDAQRFVERVPVKYRTVPQVDTIFRMVEAGDRDGLYANDYSDRPLTIAENAYRHALSVEAYEGENAWVREHGSEYLQRLYAAEMPKSSLYQTERLALEMPGWVYGGDTYMTATPKLEDLRLLEFVQATVPTARMGCVDSPARCRPIASFLGKTVYYPGSDKA